MTNVRKYSLIKAPIPNIFCSSSNLASSINVILVIILGFSHSKHTIKSKIIILASYSYVNLIAFPYPTKLSTMHKTLQCGSNMIAIMLWTYSASKDFKKSKKGFITFIISSHIFLCRRHIYVSKGFKTLNRLDNCNNLVSIFTIKVTHVVKVLNSNQWPLDWFNTHVKTTWFKANVITSTTTHTWALRTLCCKTTIFCLP